MASRTLPSSQTPTWVRLKALSGRFYWLVNIFWWALTAVHLFRHYWESFSSVMCVCDVFMQFLLGRTDSSCLSVSKPTISCGNSCMRLLRLNYWHAFYGFSLLKWSSRSSTSGLSNHQTAGYKRFNWQFDLGESGLAHAEGKRSRGRCTSWRI